MSWVLFKSKRLTIEIVSGLLFGIGVDRGVFFISIGCLLLEFNYDK